ncbi:hypothetical protein D623_10021549 [Myotis brandtii]|uniref:Uncharacterized protein n=1 Tax=Myotis brandtii TaxID=109478 RepID=S7QGG1_MYOBR|nr:hypothetical protein D623_10021549 [Myotis brandtii]
MAHGLCSVTQRDQWIFCLNAMSPHCKGLAVGTVGKTPTESRSPGHTRAGVGDERVGSDRHVRAHLRLSSLPSEVGR